MPKELEIPYHERIATVVGSNGALGSRVVSCYEDLGVKEIRKCEKDNRFLDLLAGSTDIFLALDKQATKLHLEIIRDNVRPELITVMDGTSVKGELVEPYQQIDEAGVSSCSSHLGARPDHPWRGVKLWLCRVGQNSEEAVKLGMDLFVARNTSISIIGIEEHKNVEMDQWITMATAYIVAKALMDMQFDLETFDHFATLNSEFLGLLVGRTLGQGTGVPSEVLFEQKRKEELGERLEESLESFEEVLSDRDKLMEFMQEVIDFHNGENAFVDRTFRKAGVIGARNANMRMYSFSFRVTDDAPGRLREVLLPFYLEGANITGLDSMPGVITEEEKTSGVNTDKIVDFDIAIDPKTINDEKLKKIKEELTELGCTVAENNH